VSMGLVTILTFCVAVATGFVCIFQMPPDEADESFSLWNEFIHVKSGCGTTANRDHISEALLPCGEASDDEIDSPSGTPDALGVQEEESILDFLSDGLNMFIRSMIMQATFFIALISVSKLGPSMYVFCTNLLV